MFNTYSLTLVTDCLAFVESSGQIAWSFIPWIWSSGLLQPFLLLDLLQPFPFFFGQAVMLFLKNFSRDRKSVLKLEINEMKVYFLTFRLYLKINQGKIEHFASILKTVSVHR